MNVHGQPQKKPWYLDPPKLAFSGFLGIAGYFLVTEHWAHIVPWLPYVLLLACPLLHIFMHRGHAGHGGHGGHERHGSQDPASSRQPSDPARQQSGTDAGSALGPHDPAAHRGHTNAEKEPPGGGRS